VNFQCGSVANEDQNAFHKKVFSQEAYCTIKFKKVSAGSSHNCGISQDDRLYCWGLNSDGQLGDGTTESKSTPVLVNPGQMSVNENITDVAAGFSHTCAVKSGAAFCWGKGASGRLGDGSTVDRYTPVAVDFTSNSGVSAIAAGDQHTCAIKDGAAYCWGGNGKLGNGSTSNSTTPVSVSGPMDSGVQSITTSAHHSCGVKSGAAYCWGAFWEGRLGSAVNADQTTPIAVNFIPNSEITNISAGQGHSCAMRLGAASCWGDGDHGQIGNGNTSDQLNGPVEVR
jgi:alpha-tubulin suppressor-like RCC1 family protein